MYEKSLFHFFFLFLNRRKRKSRPYYYRQAIISFSLFYFIICSLSRIAFHAFSPSVCLFVINLNFILYRMPEIYMRACSRGRIKNSQDIHILVYIYLLFKDIEISETERDTRYSSPWVIYIAAGYIPLQLHAHTLMMRIINNPRQFPIRVETAASHFSHLPIKFKHRYVYVRPCNDVFL